MMPLYSDHISNMYYSGSPSYSAPYSYNSSVSPLGTSFSASYLNSGGNYSSHSSLGGYSRSPLSTRWIPSSGRNYSPMLSTISERGTSSPVRLNSPRRVPISKRTYGTPSYTPRPININTADIDVSKDKYRHKNETVLPPAPPTPPRRQSPNTEKENGPFMPRVDGKPETGIDSSPGEKKGTIKRGRTVVRLHTLKRKERDSPRKPIEDIILTNETDVEKKEEDQNENMGWREKLSDDLIYKEKREKKTIGAKLVEKFKVKDKSDSDSETPVKEPNKREEVPTKAFANKSPDRRCSMELLAEQASLLDSLIRGENLSTATVDLSKVGLTDESDNKIQPISTSVTKRRKSNDIENPLKTTKSDQSLHDRINSLRDSKDSKQYFKRRSIRKSSSSSSICRLDSITEFPKESINVDMPTIEESRLSIKKDNGKSKTKPKLKQKITSTVEVSTPTSPLRFKVEDIIVEEKPCMSKKEIIYSSEVDEVPKQTEDSVQNEDIKSPQRKSKVRYNTRKKTTFLDDDESLPETENFNFWDKIGKRETIYLISRKQNLEEQKEKHRRAHFWHPEDEVSMNNDENETMELCSNILKDCETTTSLENNQVNECVDAESVKPNVNVKMTAFNLHQQPKTEKQEEELAVNYDTIHEFDAVNEKVEVQTSDDKGFISELKHTEVSIKNPSKSPEKVQNEITDTTKNHSNKTNIFDEVSNKEKGKEIIEDTSKLGKQIKEDIQTKIVEETSISTNKVQEDEKVKKASKITNLMDIIKKDQDIKTFGKTATIDNGTKNNEINNNGQKSTLEMEKSNIIISENIFPEETAAHKKPTSVEELKTPNVVIPEQVIQNKGNLIDKFDTTQEEPLHSSFESVHISDESTKEVVVSVNIPNENTDNESKKSIQRNTEGDNGKAETLQTIEEKSDEKPQSELIQLPVNDIIKIPSPRKPIKDEPALRPLIATPRPLQKRNPQIIHSSSSSDTSDEESSSSEDEDADESDSSEDSAEFFECENNPDGRTSTGSNDSGFDSSAPTSPSGFVHVKKGGDVPGTSNSASEQTNNSIILDHELEQSTAYGLFRKTGRFTPPARSIPRFRKYAIEDFHFIKVLGKGSFGKVLLAELRDTEYYYAVKCLKKDVVLEDDDVECTLIERKVLALGTNHPYLCHLFATFQTDSHLFFVMEYLNGGDLMFHIQQSGRFPEARARFYAAEIVSGLKFLHKRGIVYRDLKLDNILLDFDGHVRIADFGMCKLQIYLEKTADTFCGTPDYMAPEIIKGLKYNQTVDWWSFGVLLYEMLIGQSPFSGCDEDELFWSICNEIPSYPRFLSQESLSILTRLLDKDARTRLGGTECMYGDIRDQDFFRTIHWDRLDRRELETPFKPHVRHPLDTQYFDRAFTGERPRLTAVEPQVLRSMDQEQFRGFSYTNPNATDR